MRSIAVTKPDMAVLHQDRTGLSSFGMLSALFGQEVLQRSQRRLGFWQPVALELLEEEPEQAAEKDGVNINLDMTVLLKALREEQKGQREQEKREKARTMEKLVERVVLRERTERVQERSQQINIQASAIDRSHTIRVTRQAAPRRGLEPVSGITAVPAAGGWQPQWQQEHPGFPAASPKAAPAGSGGSIVLPDALRRRRERILEETALSAAAGRTEELLRRDGPVLRELLRREVSRSVEEALTRQMEASRRRPRAGSAGGAAGPEADSERTDGAVPAQESGASDFFEHGLVYRQEEEEEDWPSTSRRPAERGQQQGSYDRRAETEEPSGAEQRREAEEQLSLQRAPARERGKRTAAGVKTGRERAGDDGSDETEGEAGSQRLSRKEQAEFRDAPAGAAEQPEKGLMREGSKPLAVQDSSERGLSADEERDIQLTHLHGGEENRQSTNETLKIQRGSLSGESDDGLLHEIETELVYREAGTSEAEEQSVQAGQEHQHRGENNKKEAEKQETQQGTVTGTPAAGSQHEIETELMYREAETGEAEEQSVQADQEHRHREKDGQKEAKRQETQQGTVTGTPAAGSQHEIETELVYREAETGEAEEQSVQADQEHRHREKDGQKEAKRQETQQGTVAGIPTAGSRHEIETELMYREAGTDEAEEQSVQADQEHRHREKDGQKEVERQETQQGAVAGIPAAGSRHEIETELVYREAETDEAEEQSVQADQEHRHREKDGQKEAERQETQQGAVAGIPAAGSRHEIETGLVYREAETGEAEEQSVQADQEHQHREEDSQKETERQEAQQGTVTGTPAAGSRHEIETELVYREESPGEAGRQQGQTGQIYRAGEDHQNAAVQQGIPSQETAAESRQTKGPELIYREADTGGIARYSEQTTQEYHAGEEHRQEAETTVIRQGIPSQEVLAESRQTEGPDLVYREADTGEITQHLEQTAPEYHAGEDHRRGTETTIIRQGVPSQEVLAESRQTEGPELVYREADIGEITQHLEQTVPEYHAREDHRQGTETATIRQGVPSQEVPAESRQAKGPELVYREADTGEIAQRLEQTTQEYHAREDHQQGAETTTIRQGVPSQEVLAESRQTEGPELVYREADTEEIERHLEQAVQEYHTGEDSRSRSGSQAFPPDGAVQGPQPLPAAIPVRGHDIRTLPGMQAGLIYRENGERGPDDPAAAALHSQYSQPAASRPGVRDIRILNQRTPEQRAVSSPHREDGPAELSYLQPPEAPAAAQRKEPDNAALPQWAQRLLEKPTGPDARQSPMSYTAPPQTQQQAPGRQIQWTAPAAAPRPADITYRAKPPAEAAPPVQQATLSDRELRRAADKIYRMIEERLRREMRRSGR